MVEGVEISTYNNGPFLVTGPVLITDADGNRFPSEKETIALCRCGGSKKKPFCDGMHSRIGFRAAERAFRD